MKQFISFILKESRHIVRDRRTMLILFGMPVVLMLLFGFAISTEVRNVRTVVVTSQSDLRTRQLVDALSANEYFTIVGVVSMPDEAKRLIRNQKADMAVSFAPNFASRGGQVQIVADGADPSMSQLYAAYASQIVNQHLSGSASRRADAVSIRLLYNPQLRSSYNFVPGIMGLLLMLICAMMTSVSIVREKEQGTMEVLLVSPVRPLLIIVAKAVPYLMLAFVILSSILLIAKCVLGVPLAGNPVWIVGVSGIYIMVALSFGLLISTLVRTQFAALLASAMMLMLPSVLLSGMVFPIESMPRILQWVTLVMPPRYYISAMRKLMIMGTGIDSVLHEVAVLSLMAAVLLGAALTMFNKRLS